MASPVKKVKKVEEQEQAPEYGDVAELKRSNILRLVERHEEIMRQMEDLEEELGELKTSALKLLVKADLKTVLVEGRAVTRIDGYSSKLDKAKLLLNGVELDVIEKSTVKKPWTSVRIGKLQEGGGGEES